MVPSGYIKATHGTRALTTYPPHPPHAIPFNPHALAAPLPSSSPCLPCRAEPSRAGEDQHQHLHQQPLQRQPRQHRHEHCPAPAVGSLSKPVYPCLSTLNPKPLNPTPWGRGLDVG